MSVIKRTLSGTALVATFLFLPSETWSFWMLKNRESLYGEFSFAGERAGFALAKNLLDTAVRIEGQQVQHNWSLSLDGGPVVDLGNRSDILPASYSLLQLGSGLGSAEVLRSLDGGKYFRPVELIVAAPAEHDKWVALVIFLLGATGRLTWSVQRYVLESGHLEKDRGSD